MFVYFHWPANGNYTIQAFHKQDKAIEFVLNQLIAQSSYSNQYYKKPLNAPRLRNAIGGGGAVAAANIFADLVVAPAPVNGFAAAPAPAAVAVASPPKEDKEEVAELTELLNQIEVTKKDPSMDNIHKAMQLFDDYSKYILSNESMIHELNNIKTIE